MWIRKKISLSNFYLSLVIPLESFPHSYTSPHIHLWIFETLWVIIFLIWVICKRLNVNWKKNWLSNFICHLSFLERLSPTHTHPLISIHEFLKPYELLFLDFESFVNDWMWIGKKVYSVILSATCHSLRNFPHSYTSPHIHSWIFKTLQLIIYWVWVICKRLNVNWEINSLQ